MILFWIVFVPLGAGVLAATFGRWRPDTARVIALVALLVDLGLAVLAAAAPAQGRSPGWWREGSSRWIPAFGIRLHFGLDGLSFLLVLLTLVLGIVSVGVSRKEVRDRIGLFHGMLLWVLGGVLGVFLALDLFAFYFFWEMMLIPM